MTRFRPVVLEGFSFQPPVLDFQTTPPISPVAGDRYVVLLPATGVWAAHETQIAWFYDGAWQFDVPAIGWLLNNTSDNTLYKFDGIAWIAIAAGATLDPDDIVTHELTPYGDPLVDYDAILGMYYARDFDLLYDDDGDVLTI